MLVRDQYETIGQAASVGRIVCHVAVPLDDERRLRTRLRLP